MQQLLRDRDGVISTRVGWMGGENENPTQENNVGHAEVVEVTFDRVSKAGRFWEEAPEQQDYFQRFPVGCPAPFPRQGESARAS